jgi:hypothetical protein
MVAAWKGDTLKEVSPTPVTFNHGVEGSSRIGRGQLRASHMKAYRGTSSSSLIHVLPPRRKRLKLDN